MKTALIFAAMFGFAAAKINISEIIKGHTTKGWFFGFGLLMMVVCGAWAIKLEIAG